MAGEGTMGFTMAYCSVLIQRTKGRRQRLLDGIKDKGNQMIQHRDKVHGVGERERNNFVKGEGRW
jgi:hypothetical protein